LWTFVLIPNKRNKQTNKQTNKQNSCVAVCLLLFSFLQPDTPSFLENWSYIGRDCKRCGTVPGSTAVECLLSSTGPATLPDGACKAKCTLGAEKDRIQAPITSLPGNSGSCAIYVPDQCCVAVSSYGTSNDKDQGVCALNCENFYSPIDPDKPLSDLWAKRMAVLPDATL
jgi:hypothetical protein